MAGCALFTGLLGNSGVKHDPGTVIMLPFPVSKPVFHIHGRVAGCRNMAFHYHVGVEFPGLNLNFREQAAAHTVVTSPVRRPCLSGSTGMLGNSSAPGDAAFGGD
jgi:hypothetical protein